MLFWLTACLSPPPQEPIPAYDEKVPGVVEAVPAPVSPGVDHQIVKGPPPQAPVPVAIPVGERVPEFTLLDQNPKSPGLGHPVSPKDLLGKVAGYYFTHAT